MKSLIKSQAECVGEAVRPGLRPLGIYPRSVDSQDAEEQEKAKEIRRIASRRQLYADLKATAFILLSEMPGKRHSITKCRWTKVAPSVTLHLMDVGNRPAARRSQGCEGLWQCVGLPGLLSAYFANTARRDEYAPRLVPKERFYPDHADADRAAWAGRQDRGSSR